MYRSGARRFGVGSKKGPLKLKEYAVKHKGDNCIVQRYDKVPHGTASKLK